MNPEQSRAEQRLLNDVLSEQSDGFPGSKKPALAAFRRARILRRARRFSAAAVILATVIGAAYQHNWRSGSRPGNRASNQAVPRESADGVPRLTDHELLASFPSNSCFLAEVNGQQVLVFVDPQLKEKFVSASAKPTLHRF
jgi:hypothetical protein